MREDIAEIIIERPRIGSNRRHRDIKGLTGLYHKDKANWANGDHLTKEKMSISNRGHEGKELNENLAPLQRFIESKIGHNWNNVFSEISEHISPNSTVQMHILQHVFQYVKKDVYKIKDGKIFRIYRKENNSFGHRIELYKDEIYIDPDDNIVKKYKWGKERFRYKSQIDGRIKVDENQYIIRFVDKWYFCTFKPFDNTFNEKDAFVGKVWEKRKVAQFENYIFTGYKNQYVTSSKFNSVCQIYPGYSDYRNENRIDIYCYNKREVKDKELKKWGLK
jgi:hypothetical protein